MASRSNPCTAGIFMITCLIISNSTITNTSDWQTCTSDKCSDKLKTIEKNLGTLIHYLILNLLLLAEEKCTCSIFKVVYSL